MRLLRSESPLQPLSKVSGLNECIDSLDSQEIQQDIRRFIGIIDSMTRSELAAPETIDGWRTVRIARGSGTTSECVSDLLRQYSGMRQLMLQSQHGFKTLAPGRTSH